LRVSIYYDSAAPVHVKRALKERASCFPPYHSRLMPDGILDFIDRLGLFMKGNLSNEFVRDGFAKELNHAG
jgi:hypothetical protein